ncbi:MAG: thiamine pyrophosphate-binding protein [Candidatus Thermoplasmatota archaeon]|nr:thiamine pyrophosphate-binding protein [Candidatus Thermoplasmatota archaeon]MDA8144185.1 thiamine pyrophosphate-binding protein [Thermoplasmatales archaeon]
MKGSDAILEILQKYSVSNVFGLIGETSFPLYESWENYHNIKHISGRDERNLAIMADGYSRAGDMPGICEVPGVGASYILPGVIEAYNSGVPMIIFSSDISTNSEKRNFLTEYDKSHLFSKITKEYISINSAEEIPRLLRRAFRIATTGRMGPVFVRFPMNVYSGEVSREELFAQEQFSHYPALRTSPEDSVMKDALKLLARSSRPVMVCGQGVLLSHAQEEVMKFSEMLQIPVGTTISGKGSYRETSPLSIGVVGSRGGTKFSNGILDSADLIFFVGTNTDSASTSEWKHPPFRLTNRGIIHLDISEAELGNNYATDVFLYGDVKLTLSRMMKLASEDHLGRKSPEITSEKNNAEKLISDLAAYNSTSVNPVHLVKSLEAIVPDSSIITADPGVGAIYSSAYFRVRKPGRKFIFNYSVGGLGFSLPAAIGAYFAKNTSTVCLTTDGSFGFFQGELETVRRYDADIKIILVNNGSFGWIRATMVTQFDKVISGTDFSEVDYSKIASAHGIRYDRIERDSEVAEKISKAFAEEGPILIEVIAEPEDRLVPPVPEWEQAARKHGTKYMG